MNELKELVQFLHPNQRVDLKAVALMHVLGLTGSTEGKDMLMQIPEITEHLYHLTADKTPSIAKDATLCLINISAEEEGAVRIYQTSRDCVPSYHLTKTAIDAIVDADGVLSDPWSMVLSNLTRVEQLVGVVLDEIESDENSLLKLTKAFTKLDYNKKAKLHYLGPIFCNLTQTQRGRELFFNSKYNLLEKVTSFVTYEDSIVRRGGAIGILKNICFDPVFHEAILSEKSDSILVSILYPLAGNEEFDDEDTEKLPLELQYLGEDKTREEDPDLRRMLLESLLQLCATQKYREFLRKKGTYEILREYHKWEVRVGKDKEALLACENVVDILIRKEEEIGKDNLKDISVPEDLSNKFVEDDQQYLAD